jgi:hypothetical protein
MVSFTTSLAMLMIKRTSSTSASPAVTALPGCHADNCARAVSGTYQGLQSSHKQDCSSYFKATVYPATVTKTSTTTVYPFTSTKTVTTSILSQTSTVYPSTDVIRRTTSTLTQSTTIATVFTTIATITSSKRPLALRRILHSAIMDWLTNCLSLATITGTETSTIVQTLTFTGTETDTAFSTFTLPNAKRAVAATASTVRWVYHRPRRELEINL